MKFYRFFHVFIFSISFSSANASIDEFREMFFNSLNQDVSVSSQIPVPLKSKEYVDGLKKYKLEEKSLKKLEEKVTQAKKHPGQKKNYKRRLNHLHSLIDETRLSLQKSKRAINRLEHKLATTTHTVYHTLGKDGHSITLESKTSTGEKVIKLIAQSDHFIALDNVVTDCPFTPVCYRVIKGHDIKHCVYDPITDMTIKFSINNQILEMLYGADEEGNLIFIGCVNKVFEGRLHFFKLTPNKTFESIFTKNVELASFNSRFFPQTGKQNIEWRHYDGRDKIKHYIVSPQVVGTVPEYELDINHAIEGNKILSFNRNSGLFKIIKVLSRDSTYVQKFLDDENILNGSAFFSGLPVPYSLESIKGEGNKVQLTHSTCFGEIATEIVHHDSKSSTWKIASPRTLGYIRKNLEFAKRFPQLRSYTISDDEDSPFYYMSVPNGDGPFSVLVDIHGGPRVRDSIANTNSSLFFSDRAIVIRPMFRGSGFSLREEFGSQGTGLTRMVDDCVECIKHALHQLGPSADATKIFLQGGSYGAQACSIINSFYPPEELGFVPAGFMMLNGSYDPLDAGVNCSTDEFEFTLRFFQPEHLYDTGKLNEEGQAFALSRSAIAHPNIYTPILLMYGTLDKVVPPAHTHAYLNSLKSSDPETSLLHCIEVQGAGHSLCGKEAYSVFKIINNFMALNGAPGIEVLPTSERDIELREMFNVLSGDRTFLFE